MVKPTAAVKNIVENKMKPFIEKLKEDRINPIPNPQRMNHLIDIYGKWNRNFYYLYMVYKCPPTEGYKVDKFDVGLARLRYVGNEKFDISYFRHTGKWQDLPFYQELSVDECMEAISEGGEWFL